MPLLFRGTYVAEIMPTDCVDVFCMLFMIDSDGENANQWIFIVKLWVCKTFKNMLKFMENGYVPNSLYIENISCTF